MLEALLPLQKWNALRRLTGAPVPIRLQSLRGNRCFITIVDGSPYQIPGALGAWHALVPPALPVQGKYELRRAREVIGSVEDNVY